MQFLPLFSFLIDNNNSFLWSSISVGLACGYIEDIDLLLFSFNVDLANGGAKNVCFISKIFSRIIIKLPNFSLDLEITEIFQISTSSKSKVVW